VVCLLRLLEYQEVPGSPAQPGQYSAERKELQVYARGFRFPDKDYPAQVLRLEFDAGRLSDLRLASGERAERWRLEPPLLARWRSATAADRPRVRIAELPPHVPAAVLSVEDKRFYRHGTFDWMGIARALWIDIRQGNLSQGGSTISQQLARSVFLDTRRTLRRKVLEAGLALYLELRYAKPQLLEMYLNQVYWGREGGENLLGIEAASQSYFGKPARRLTASEAAMLAGLLHSPNRLSPRTAMAAARARRNVVLALMRDQNLLAPAPYAQALQEPIRLAPEKTKRSPAAYFLAMLRDQLEGRYSAQALASQGWRIFTTLDLVLQEEAVASLKPRQGQAAMVVLEPGTGAIRAWLGGTDPVAAPLDRAYLSPRQPGSAFKPFVYLAALESRKATVATPLKDEPLTLKGSSGEWSPRNFDLQYRGEVLAREGLIHSLNIPTVRLAMQTGLESILDAARRAGIQSPLRADLSTSLGASETTVLELTNAYATLAAGGIRAEPYAIESIQAADGALLERHEAATAPAFDPGPVFLVTEMLRATFEEGTASAARRMGFRWPAAGKTGTSENFVDAWFVGYTPNLACGVWVGYDQPKSLGRSAAGIALPLWTAFMDRALKMLPPSPFPEAQGLVRKSIDPETGLLTRTGCPRRVDLYFLPGTEPTEHCPRHPGGLVGFFKRLTR
jgi:penicillin-binding protein 1B